MGEFSSFSVGKNSSCFQVTGRQTFGSCFKNHHCSEKFRNVLFIYSDYGQNFPTISFSGKTPAGIRELASFLDPASALPRPHPRWPTWISRDTPLWGFLQLSFLYSSWGWKHSCIGESCNLVDNLSSVSTSMLSRTIFCLKLGFQSYLKALQVDFLKKNQERPR